MSVFTNLFSGVSLAKKLPDMAIGGVIVFVALSFFLCGKGKNTVYLQDSTLQQSLQHQIDSLKSIPKDTVRLTELRNRYFSVPDTVKDSVFFITKINLCDSLIAAYTSAIENKDSINVSFIHIYEEKISGLILERDSLLSQLNKPRISDALKKILQYDVSASVGTGVGLSLLRVDASLRFKNYEIGIEPSLFYANSKVNPALIGIFSYHF